MTWKQQLANSLTAPEQLAARFGIDPAPLRAVANRYPLRITPYYLDLIETPGDPIWRQCVPDPAELAADTLPEDSMNEAAFAPVASIVHRYPDRALLLVLEPLTAGAMLRSIEVEVDLAHIERPAIEVEGAGRALRKLWRC